MNSIKNLQRQKDKVGNARVLCGKQKCASINKILTQKKKIFETEKHLKCPENYHYKNIMIVLTYFILIKIKLLKNIIYMLINLINLETKCVKNLVKK